MVSAPPSSSLLTPSPARWLVVNRKVSPGAPSNSTCCWLQDLGRGETFNSLDAGIQICCKGTAVGREGSLEAAGIWGGDQGTS